MASDGGLADIHREGSLYREEILSPSVKPKRIFQFLLSCAFVAMNVVPRCLLEAGCISVSIS